MKRIIFLLMVGCLVFPHFSYAGTLDKAIRIGPYFDSAQGGAAMFQLKYGLALDQKMGLEHMHSNHNGSNGSNGNSSYIIDDTDLIETTNIYYNIQAEGVEIENTSE